jgi:hypothetical protein
MDLERQLKIVEVELKQLEEKKKQLMSRKHAIMRKLKQNGLPRNLKELGLMYASGELLKHDFEDFCKMMYHSDTNYVYLDGSALREIVDYVVKQQQLQYVNVVPYVNLPILTIVLVETNDTFLIDRYKRDKDMIRLK